MSVRRMHAFWLLVAVVVAGYVPGADAQVTPWPLAFVDGPNVAMTAQPAVPAQAAAPAQPAVPQQVVPTPAPAPAPSSRPSQVPPNPWTVPARTTHLSGLSAVLVTGDTEEAPAGRGSAPRLEVPAAARKALASISSFLPYKSYSMADAALVSATVGQSSVVIMRDPELSNTLLRLQLGPTVASREVLVTSPESYNVNVSLSELNTARPDDKTGRQLISTSVSVAPGETVVVGTSRIGGGRKAYVLLLTAIGK